jgi:RNA polymerase-binding protein DksA
MNQLGEEQIAQLRGALKARQKELLEEIRNELVRSDQEHYVDLAGKVHDSGDEAVADLLNDVNLAVIDHQIQALREVEAALLRISDGRYGQCEDCSAPVGFTRLESYPTATRCIACQERYEKGFAQPGRPSL